MKNLFLMILLICFQMLFSQNSSFEHEKTAHFIKIWGLMKYQHPEVSKGTFDFDEAFVLQYQKLESIQNIEIWNETMLQWMNQFEHSKTKYVSNEKFIQKKGLFTKNADFDWIENSGFSPALTQKLLQIKNNRNIGHYYAKIIKINQMVSMANDQSYPNFDEKIASHRMLFLASFWNKMRYWNVNIYLTETNWSEVLNQMIPQFQSDDWRTYQIAKDQLFAALNDSHANYEESFLFKDSLQRKTVYGGKIVNDTLVITTLYNKKIAAKEGIEKGDYITKINGKTIDEFIKTEFSHRLSSSNEAYLKRILAPYYLLSGNFETLQIELIKPNKTIQNKQINLYPAHKISFDTLKKKQQTITEHWKLLEVGIGYINLKYINKKELQKAFENLKDTHGIIIDLRNYPKYLQFYDVPKHILPKRTQFIKVLGPVLPSYAEYDIKAPMRFLLNPFKVGRKNSNHYKGKIVLLVDASTGSNAEFIAMTIQSSLNCITMGSQTFGAVLNRNEVILTDNTTLDFTGMGAFYPDTDTEAQRNGLRIDLKIQPSTASYHKDVLMEEAMDFLRKTK